MATTFTDGNFNYEVVSSVSPYTVNLTGFFNAAGITVLNNIPATATDPGTSIVYNVIGTGYGAFQSNTTLTTVVIPANLQYLGVFSFYLCSNITSLTFEPGVTTIGFADVTSGNSCFNACTSLTSVVFPASVTVIGEGAFYDCANLANVQFLSTTLLPAISGSAFINTQTGITVKYNPTVTNLNSVSLGPTAGTQPLSAFFTNPHMVANYPCFKEGTKILTDTGYKLVQNLRKGDLVKTLLNGYKPITLIGKREIYHSASEERIKDQLYKYSQKQHPDLFEDLVITGAHSVLVDDISEEQREKITDVLGKIYVTDNKYRLPASVDKRASVYEPTGTYTIYHFALDNESSRGNYGVYANGLLVETCSKRYLSDFSNMELL